MDGNGKEGNDLEEGENKMRKTEILKAIKSTIHDYEEREHHGRSLISPTLWTCVDESEREWRTTKATNFFL